MNAAIEKDSETVGFTVSAEPRRGLIRLKLTKPLTPDVLVALHDELARAFRELDRRGASRGEYLIFSDSRRHGLQTKQVTENLDALATEISSVAKRVAVLVSTTLHKMQVQRVAPESNVRSFLTEEEAMAWLLG